MITLLLSLLNNDDLKDLAEFLNDTYKLRADRQHLELLFLKVIPLMSINPKVFLRAMIPAFEGYAMPEPVQEQFFSNYWNTFITHIMNFGYLLPGTVGDLGRDHLSWILKWPEDGFKSSTVFRNLQYAGCRSRAFNDIPPIDLHPETNTTELPVIMTNGEKHIIYSGDLERMTCLTPGVYTVREARHGGSRLIAVLFRWVLR
jgi:hypothetical protein